MAILSSSVDSYDVSTKNRIVNALLVINTAISRLYVCVPRGIERVDVQTFHQTSGCTKQVYQFLLCSKSKE